MRTTELKRTTTGVVIVIVLILVLLGVLRALVTTPERSPAQRGAALFQEMGCSRCHDTDSREAKVGPGLEGLFDRSELPVSGRSVTEETVRDQLRSPYKNMPSFADRLDHEQMHLIAKYLKTL